MLDEFKGRVDAVPFITADEGVLVDRLSERWTCRASGHIYNEKFNPPKNAGKCDFDGSELYQRDDDKAETVKHRIQVYLDQTSPLIAYYRDRGILFEIDGMQTIELVTQAMMTALKK
jgi:adenylate kinase